jgi:hypothetical protein
MKLWCCNHIVDPARPTKGGPATCGFITRAQPLLNQGTRNNPLAIRLRNCVSGPAEPAAPTKTLGLYLPSAKKTSRTGTAITENR